MTTGPHFIGIGAHKGGTSWLDQQLRAHPDIWMPPLKELHYFDRSPRFPSPSFLAPASLVERLAGRTPEAREARAHFLGRFRAALRARSLDQLAWTARYALGQIDDRWYSSLFSGRPGKVTGEITPGYSLLADGDVAQVARAFPELRAVFIARNPVDRAWSHVRFKFGKRRRGGAPPTLDEMRALLSTPRARALSDTLGIITRWRRGLGQGRVWVGYFDDLAERPADLLRSVYRFLGVGDRPEFVPADAGKAVHVSPGGTAPPELLRWLAELHLPATRALAEAEGGGVPARWVENLEARVRGDV